MTGACAWQVTNPVASKVDEGGVQEVIEFPWVIIDVASKSIVESKVVYLKPEHCPELGDRCKAITGLDDETLAAGCSLQECVQELNDYLYKQVTSQNKDFCFVTDGDTSLKRWLRSDAKVKKVKLAAHYQKFIDLRAEFKAKYPKWAGVDSGPSMASRLGIELEPSVDGGLRLCNALAAVAVQLLEDCAPFTKTVSISDDYDALADPLFVKGGPRYHEPLRAKCVQGDAMPESKVVKCRGMPYSAQKHDLEAFFGTCRIADVWIVLNQFGRATGEAYVTFETSLDALRATHRCRDLMNQRYVEVFASTQAEADATRASMAAGATISGIGAVGGTDDMQFGGVCKLRGLPYTCSYDDIKRFFDGIPIKKDGITLCENREGRNNGEAYVEFEVEQGATEASKRDRMSLGSRYIEVYKCTKADLATYLSNRAQMHASLLGMSAGGVPTGPEYFIKVRGLPFTAREPEVVAFFAKAGVVPQGVSLVYNSRDQPNGECYVELASADDLSRGLTLHRDTMGHRYVELFRTTRTEAMQALRLPQPAAAAAAAAQAYMNPVCCRLRVGAGAWRCARPSTRVVHLCAMRACSCASPSTRRRRGGSWAVLAVLPSSTPALLPLSPSPLRASLLLTHHLARARASMGRRTCTIMGRRPMLPHTAWRPLLRTACPSLRLRLCRCVCVCACVQTCNVRLRVPAHTEAHARVWTSAHRAWQGCQAYQGREAVGARCLLCRQQGWSKFEGFRIA